MIFDRFYQSEPIPGVTGSGIGLHMVKEYVSLHNGKIEVHSKIGVGTTFLIYIPSDLKGDDSESKIPAMSPDVEEKVNLIFWRLETEPKAKKLPYISRRT